MEQGEAKIKVNPVYSGSQNRAGARAPQSPELLYGREGWRCGSPSRQHGIRACRLPAACHTRGVSPRGVTIAGAGPEAVAARSRTVPGQGESARGALVARDPLAADGA